MEKVEEKKFKQQQQTEIGPRMLADFTMLLFVPLSAG